MKSLVEDVLRTLGWTAARSPAPARGDLAALYATDETAWLDAMAAIAAEGRREAIDCDHLGEYLHDMAQRDRREVLSRLTILLMHLLKWDRQPDHRSPSWRRTIAEQRLELGDLFESATLARHGREVLPRAYSRAVRLAATETGLGEGTFPGECPWPFEDVLDGELAD
jgi:hypothetical protein